MRRRLSQQSSLSTQAYTYDGVGRLTQVQSTPAGKGCTTRVYAYDEEGNRTSLTTRPPNGQNECSGEGGASEGHSYDEANRLIDAGTAYSSFGNITALPAPDAGGSELASSYYVDGSVNSQNQGGQTLGYGLDPAERTRETVGTGNRTFNTISHYAGPGSSPAWTANTTGEWTRNIYSIGGTLAAVQSNGETPVLQLTNLHGDIVATAYASETASSLAATADTSEFGVPATSVPPKYSWLGALQLPTELPSGVIAMGVRSYVPQLGRFLQPDPVPGGSANAYSYTFGDPVNSSDPSGALTYGFSAWAQAANESMSAALVAREAARERTEREAAEQAAREAAAREAAAQAAREAAWDAQWGAGPQYMGGGEEGGEEPGEEEYEEGEEEGGYEYVSHHQRGKEMHDELRIEPAVLYQPLREANVGWSEDQQPEPGGLRHEASGNGCGGGGYCGGRWIKASDRHHRHGERIGGDPWEPFNVLCATFWWAHPVVAGACAVGESINFYRKAH
jgi:RHS repeat-associated protein